MGNQENALQHKKSFFGRKTSVNGRVSQACDPKRAGFLPTNSPQLASFNREHEFSREQERISGTVF